MRLVNVRTFKLKEFGEDDVPPYAILSHTWGPQEASLRDLQKATSISIKTNRIYRKIVCACFQARKDCLQWLWVDTVCIDSTSSIDVQEAVNSAFNWYRRSEMCYVYLDDLDGSCPLLSDTAIEASGRPGQQNHRIPFWAQSMATCRWFTRGWALPELIAPVGIKFFGKTWRLVATKAKLVRYLARITGIDAGVLTHARKIGLVSIATRMSWAANRRTTRVEDRAYSLLGIFGVSMPIVYGEGNRAFARLQEEIMKFSNDQSIFAWSSEKPDGTVLMADSPDDFALSRGIVVWGRPKSFQLTNQGLRATLPVIFEQRKHETGLLAVLNLRHEDDLRGALALRLRQYPGNFDQFYLASGDGTEDKDASRLVVVDADTLKTAEMRVVEITRRRESPQWQRSKFLLRTTHSDSGEPDTQVLRLQPAEYWNPQTSVLVSPGGPHVRASAQVRLQSGRDIVLEFGYDDIFKFDDSGRTFTRHLIPGLRIIFVGRNWNGQKPEWAKEHAYWFCSDHSKCGAIDRLRKGCPNTPTVAEIGMPGDPEVIRIQIKAESAMEERVFAVDFTVSRLHHDEIDRPCTPSSNSSRTAVEGRDSFRSSPTSPVSMKRFLRPASNCLATPDWMGYAPPSAGNTKPFFKPALLETPTQQRILLRNAHHRSWKVFREGLLEVEKAGRKPTLSPQSSSEKAKPTTFVKPVSDENARRAARQIPITDVQQMPSPDCREIPTPESNSPSTPRSKSVIDAYLKLSAWPSYDRLDVDSKKELVLGASVVKRSVNG